MEFKILIADSPCLEFKILIADSPCLEFKILIADRVKRDYCGMYSGRGLVRLTPPPLHLSNESSTQKWNRDHDALLEEIVVEALL